MTAVNMPAAATYPPAQLEIDGPPGPQPRLAFLFRFFTSLDLLILAFGRGIMAFLHAIRVWFSVLIGEKVPEDSFNYITGAIRFNTKYHAYLWGLAGVKPGTGVEDDPSYSVRMHVQYQATVPRLRALINPLMAIVLYVAFIPGLILGVIGMYLGALLVLFTGRYPDWPFAKAARLMEWGTRMGVLMLVLTDVQPQIEFV
jgi:hypothetical protein